MKLVESIIQMVLNEEKVYKIIDNWGREIDTVVGDDALEKYNEEHENDEYTVEEVVEKEPEKEVKPEKSESKSSKKLSYKDYVKIINDAIAIKKKRIAELEQEEGNSGDVIQLKKDLGNFIHKAYLKSTLKKLIKKEDWDKTGRIDESVLTNSLTELNQETILPNDTLQEVIKQVSAINNWRVEYVFANNTPMLIGKSEEPILEAHDIEIIGFNSEFEIYGLNFYGEYYGLGSQFCWKIVDVSFMELSKILKNGELLEILGKHAINTDKHFDKIENNIIEESYVLYNGKKKIFNDEAKKILDASLKTINNWEITANNYYTIAKAILDKPILEANKVCIDVENDEIFIYGVKNSHVVWNLGKVPLTEIAKYINDQKVIYKLYEIINSKFSMEKEFYESALYTGKREKLLPEDRKIRVIKKLQNLKDDWMLYRKEDSGDYASIYVDTPIMNATRIYVSNDYYEYGKKDSFVICGCNDYDYIVWVLKDISVTEISRIIKDKAALKHILGRFSEIPYDYHIDENDPLLESKNLLESMSSNLNESELIKFKFNKKLLEASFNPNVKSSWITQIWFEPNDDEIMEDDNGDIIERNPKDPNILGTVFMRVKNSKTGKVYPTYEFPDVPRKVYIMWRRARSKGKYFWRKMKYGYGV